ncbi:MAG: hypothetical protein KIS87_13865 [Phycisphaeraceae bacterium]|nr:hypothetical protein [Phycisphaeraceae bacterium]
MSRGGPVNRCFDVAFLGLCLTAGVARAGGSPENVLLIIDPLDRRSLQLGHHYKAVRDIPDSNVLYMEPGATNFASFAQFNLAALFATIKERGLAEQIDYIVIAPADVFFVSAPGLVIDGCSPVTRFSLSGAYSLAFMADEVLAGGMGVLTPNRYYSGTDAPRAFDSEIRWLNGFPSDSPDARRYFIGAMLGYTGQRGNTPSELFDMIDRSAAVDGVRPPGTFYFMQTTDQARSGPRHGAYPAAVASIVSLGGQAEHQMAVLPNGRHDCLGVMTGIASLDVPSADMTILPGAFCDHLTSFAGMFDTGSQTKMSHWIASGASGTWGTVQEPCNYPGKFPHARMHLYYFQGMSLGESVFRAVSAVPFQGLLYGDPITRPHDHVPTVTVVNPPEGPVSGTINLTQSGTTTKPGASVVEFDLLVDGKRYDRVFFFQTLTLDSTLLSDGWHDMRVLGYDSTDVRSTGTWVGPLVVNNRGRSASIGGATFSGNWNTAFTFDLDAAGSGLREVRLLQHGRVVAASKASPASLTVHGWTLGAGVSRLQAEALYADGMRVRSAPVEVTVSFSGATPSGQPPVASDYSVHVKPGDDALVELPHTFDDRDVPVGFEILTSPAKASVIPGPEGPFRLIRAGAGATGMDTMTFRVTSATGDSNVATVRILYSPCVADFNGDARVDTLDFIAFLNAFTSGDLRADVNDDGTVTTLDFIQYLNLWNAGCL